MVVGLSREGIIPINSVNIFRGLLHQSVHIFKVLAALVSLGGDGPHGVAEAGPDLPGEGVRPDDIYPGLSLVELLHYCSLIGRELQSVATPALLCHKEPARRIQSPLLGALERHKG